MSGKPYQIYFDRWARRYDRDLADFGYSLPKHIPGILAPLLGEKPRILDIGIGTGLISGAIKAQTPDAFIAGVDVSPRMMAVTRAKQVADDMRLCDAGRQILPYAADDFDVAVAAGLLEFIENPLWLLSQCARVLKEGGYCLLAFETSESAPLYKPGILKGVIRHTPEAATVRRIHYTPWPRIYYKYLHHAPYIASLAARVGLQLVDRHEVDAYHRPNGDHVRHDILIFKLKSPV